MLDYTKAIFNKTKKDLDIALTLFQLSTQIVYIIYLICILFTSSPIWYLYLALLVISIAFLVFDIVTRNGIKALRKLGIPFFGTNENKERLNRTKKKRSDIRRIKFFSSHVLKLLVLASSLYPIIVSPYDVHAIHIICTTVMLLMWMMQILLEVMRLIFSGRLELFYEAMHADIEFVTKPVNNVKNAFKRLVGKEIEEPSAPSKKRLFLDELVARRKEEAAAKKMAESQNEWDDDEPKAKRKRGLKHSESYENEYMDKTLAASFADASESSDDE